MKLIIDIDEEIYNEIKSIVRKPENLYPLDVAIRNGTPYEERKGENKPLNWLDRCDDDYLSEN